MSFAKEEIAAFLPAVIDEGARHECEYAHRGSEQLFRQAQSLELSPKVMAHLWAVADDIQTENSAIEAALQENLGMSAHELGELLTTAFAGIDVIRRPLGAESNATVKKPGP